MCRAPGPAGGAGELDSPRSGDAGEEAEGLGQRYDAIIIGAGLIGVFTLAEAVRQGNKRVLVLDKADRVGGLWNHLPEWQTVQNAPVDFCMQGFTTNKAEWRTRDVLHMLSEYIRVQSLWPYIRLNSEVAACHHDGKKWTLQVRVNPEEDGDEVESYTCDKLLVCTGRHARPIMPAIHTDGSVAVLHSSDPRCGKYFDKRVVVVGAGASALDLVIHSLQAAPDGEEKRVHWVLRKPKFFGGTDYNNLLAVTIMQLIFGTLGTTMISIGLDFIMRVRFWWAGLSHWLPKHTFDLRREQFIPNRSFLVENAKRVDRRAGVFVKRIVGGKVLLSDGSVVTDVDAVLLGTGFDNPAHPKGVLDKDLDHTPDDHSRVGKLFFFGETLLDKTSSTPMSTHMLMNLFWRLTRTDAVYKLKAWGFLDAGNGTDLNHIDMLNFWAPLDRELFPFLFWRWRMLWVHVYYRLRHNTTVFYADRVLGTGLSLDGKQSLSAAA